MRLKEFDGAPAERAVGTAVFDLILGEVKRFAAIRAVNIKRVGIVLGFIFGIAFI